MKAPFFSFALLSGSLFGASPFTTEEFTTMGNTGSWFIYDYSTGTFPGPPEWNAITPGGTNPEASTEFTAEHGVSFVATQSSSFGTFSGNFTEAGIDGIDCDIYVESSALIQSVEFVFRTQTEFYYSDPFSVNDDGWSILQYSFSSEPWYILDGNTFIEVVITDEILSDITQIGVNFFPISGNSPLGSRVGLDNFTLMGRVPNPPLGIENGSDLALSFPRVADFTYTIETSNDLSSENWNNLSPETTDLTGTSPFETTLTRSLKQFFRLVVAPIYYVVSDIGA